MAVIKSPHAETFLKDAVSLDLGDLSRQAARLRAAAEAKAAQIIADAEAEATRLTETAPAKGFDQGHARGLAPGIGAGRAGIKVTVQPRGPIEQRASNAWRPRLPARGTGSGRGRGRLQYPPEPDHHPAAVNDPNPVVSQRDGIDSSIVPFDDNVVRINGDTS